MKRLAYINCVLTAALIVLVIYSFGLDVSPQATRDETSHSPILTGPPHSPILTEPPREVVLSRISSVSATQESTSIDLVTIDTADVTTFVSHVTVTVDFGYLLRELKNVPEANRRQIVMLLQARRQTASDLLVALVKEGKERPGPDTPDALLHKEKLHSIDQKIAALSGEQNADVVKLLELSGSMAIVDQSISPYMHFAGVPLERDQQLQLARVMNAMHIDQHSPLYRNILTGDLKHLQQENAAFVEAAQVFLSGEQLKVLAEHLFELELRKSTRPGS